MPSRQISPLQERSRTPDYAAQVLHAIFQITTAKGPPELIDRLVSATAAIGASASVYTATIPEGGREHSGFSLFACDPVFAQTPSIQGPVFDHPWFRFARTHTIPGTHRHIRIEDRADAVAISLARQYGFRSCLIVPTPAGFDVDRVEMLCLGSDYNDDFEGDEARVVRVLARSLAAELHDWLTRYLSQSLRKVARLRPRDLDLLAMERMGLGTKKISLLTGRSEKSINARFQRINSRLNCANRKESAVRAAAHGLLETIDF